MTKRLDLDLGKLRRLAFDRAEWAEGAMRDYHLALRDFNEATIKPLRRLYKWMFVPITLWPFNVQDLLQDCLSALRNGKRLNSRQLLVITLLPDPPNKQICTIVADYELNVQKGAYEDLIKTQAKYLQNKLAIHSDPELRRQWAGIKAAFDVQAYCDHKGVIRRTMGTERNLRPSFSINFRHRDEVFQAAFDAFCLRWNLYGMQNDEPLLLKLAVNLTPYGTMIHIPSYWSFDPKRDICWDLIAKLHRIRVPGRQGSALAAGLARRMQDAANLRRLDQEARRRGLKGEKKHEFLCAGLAWDPRTSAKRFMRLRAEFH